MPGASREPALPSPCDFRDLPGAFPGGASKAELDRRGVVTRRPDDGHHQQLRGLTGMPVAMKPGGAPRQPRETFYESPVRTVLSEFSRVRPFTLRVLL